MAEPFIGEIRLFGFSFNPKLWMPCDGAQYPIRNYTALFAIIGTTYGGDGQMNFKVPDLRARAAIGMGQGNGLTPQVIGQVSGQNAVTLDPNQIPGHNHVLNAGTLTAPNPEQNVASPSSTALLGISAPNNVYLEPVAPDTTMSPSSISPAGDSLPHENRQPYLGINFCIAYSGVFPARN